VDESRLSEARVKLYVHTRSNAFKTVEEYVTLGHRIQNQETEEYLAALRKIWHLFIQEPQGIPGDDFEKDINYSSMLCQKLYFSIELQPGKKEPKVKTYAPTWNYVRSEQETIENYEEIFRLCNHPWGEEGKYKSIFTDAL
jgi:dimethylallyldiphosphate transferase